MKTMTKIVWLCAGFGLLTASFASAQAASPATEKFYVNVNLGGQLADRTMTSNLSVPNIYEETATLTSTVPIGKGMVVDFGAGYRVWHDVYVGVVVTRFSNTTDASYTAVVPDPVVFGRPVTTTGTETTLDHSEVGFHPNVSWIRPLTDKIDISLAGGAAFIRLKQRLITNFTVPVGSQSVVPLLGDESGTAKGFFGQADFIYNLKPMYGIGGYVRYAGGKVDLQSVTDQNVGGMQVGGGVRVRF